MILDKADEQRLMMQWLAMTPEQQRATIDSCAALAVCLNDASGLFKMYPPAAFVFWSETMLATRTQVDLIIELLRKE